MHVHLPRVAQLQLLLSGRSTLGWARRRCSGGLFPILKLGWWLVFQEVPVDERAGNSDQTLENGLEVARRAVERVGEGLVVVQAGRPTV